MCRMSRSSQSPARCFVPSAQVVGPLSRASTVLHFGQPCCQKFIEALSVLGRALSTSEPTGILGFSCCPCLLAVRAVLMQDLFLCLLASAMLMPRPSAPAVAATSLRKCRLPCQATLTLKMCSFLGKLDGPKQKLHEVMGHSHRTAQTRPCRVEVCLVAVLLWRGLRSAALKIQEGSVTVFPVPAVLGCRCSFLRLFLELSGREAHALRLCSLVRPDSLSPLSSASPTEAPAVADSGCIVRALQCALQGLVTLKIPHLQTGPSPAHAA